jgi:hypothetical protein
LGSCAIAATLNRQTINPKRALFMRWWSGEQP